MHSLWEDEYMYITLTLSVTYHNFSPIFEKSGQIDHDFQSWTQSVKVQGVSLSVKVVIPQNKQLLLVHAQSFGG